MLTDGDTINLADGTCSSLFSKALVNKFMISLFTLILCKEDNSFKGLSKLSTKWVSASSFFSGFVANLSAKICNYFDSISKNFSLILYPRLLPLFSDDLFGFLFPLFEVCGFSKTSSDGSFSKLVPREHGFKVWPVIGTGRKFNRSTQEAQEVRNKYKQYFNGLGAVAWQ